MNSSTPQICTLGEKCGGEAIGRDKAAEVKACGQPRAPRENAFVRLNLSRRGSRRDQLMKVQLDETRVSSWREQDLQTVFGESMMVAVLQFLETIAVGKCKEAVIDNANDEWDVEWLDENSEGNGDVIERMDG